MKEIEAKWKETDLEIVCDMLDDVLWVLVSFLTMMDPCASLFFFYYFLYQTRCCNTLFFTSIFIAECCLILYNFHAQAHTADAKSRCILWEVEVEVLFLSLIVCIWKHDSLLGSSALCVGFCLHWASTNGCATYSTHVLACSSTKKTTACRMLCVGWMHWLAGPEQDRDVSSQWMAEVQKKKK